MVEQTLEKLIYNYRYLTARILFWAPRKIPISPLSLRGKHCGDLLSPDSEKPNRNLGIFEVPLLGGYLLEG